MRKISAKGAVFPAAPFFRASPVLIARLLLACPLTPARRGRCRLAFGTGAFGTGAFWKAAFWRAVSKVGLMIVETRNTALAALLAAAAALAGCASDDGYRAGTEPSISIPYDPYDFDPDELLAEAQSHCGAYGLRAVFDGETVDRQSVRWRYRHYRCV